MSVNLHLEGYKNDAGHFEPKPEVPSVLPLGHGIDLSGDATGTENVQCGGLCGALAQSYGEPSACESAWILRIACSCMRVVVQRKEAS